MKEMKHLLHTIKRRFQLFKMRVQATFRNVLWKVLEVLANHGLVVRHKHHASVVNDLCSPTIVPQLSSNRFVYNVSYVIRKLYSVSEYWYETKGGKRLFTLYDSNKTELFAEFRLELFRFFAHFSHKDRKWVDGKFDCRYALSFNIPNRFEEQILRDKTIPMEVLDESYKVLFSRLNQQLVETNRLLTGNEFDGELVSPTKHPLAERIICGKCGYPVFATDLTYNYECINHGKVRMEDCTYIRYIEEYNKVVDNCLTELEKFCECPQD